MMSNSLPSQEQVLSLIQDCIHQTKLERGYLTNAPNDIGQKLLALLKEGSHDHPRSVHNLLNRHYRAIGADLFDQWLTQAAYSSQVNHQIKQNFPTLQLTRSQTATLILDVLSQNPTPKFDLQGRSLAIEGFGKLCRQLGLVNDEGLFHDPHKILKFLIQ